MAGEVQYDETHPTCKGLKCTMRCIFLRIFLMRHSSSFRKRKTEQSACKYLLNIFCLSKLTRDRYAKGHLSLIEKYFACCVVLIELLSSRGWLYIVIYFKITYFQIYFRNTISSCFSLKFCYLSARE